MSIVSIVCVYEGPQVTKSRNLIRFQPNTLVSLSECVSVVSASNCLAHSPCIDILHSVTNI